jgi:hypothetical protein
MYGDNIDGKHILDLNTQNKDLPSDGSQTVVAGPEQQTSLASEGAYYSPEWQGAGEVQPKAELELNTTGAGNGPSLQTQGISSFYSYLGYDQASIMRLAAGVLLLFVMVLMGAAYYIGESSNPIENLQTLWSKIAEAFGDDESQVEQVVTTSVAQVDEKPEEQTAEDAAPATGSKPVAEEVVFSEEMIQNPYWFLPNTLEVKSMELTEMSPSNEKRWSAGLGHQYMYQRYATVKEIRRSHSKGSETLLYEALEQPKFWTRMEALFGLVELGIAVDSDTVLKAIGNTRPSLVKNYFTRFSKKSTPYEIYVMKQALRLVTSGARLVIMKNLYGASARDIELYVMAAAYDPNEKVRNWATTVPVGYMLTDASRANFERVVIEGWKMASNKANSPAAGRTQNTVDNRPSSNAPVDNTLVRNAVLYSTAAQDLAAAELEAQKIRQAKEAKKEDTIDPAHSLVNPETKPVDDGFTTLKAKEMEVEDPPSGDGMQLNAQPNAQPKVRGGDAKGAAAAKNKSPNPAGAKGGAPLNKGR